MSIGRVIRAIGGFFYVEPVETPEEPLECYVRGKMRLKTQTISVGDKVTYEMEKGKAVITGIVERESLLKRPYIANVSLLVLVFAHTSPDPNELLITKFLVLAEQSGIPLILVFNKTDLVSEAEATQISQRFQKYGYRVFCSSVLQQLGRAELVAQLQGKISVFAGPSGVGKSALLNMVAPGFALQTGKVSDKIGRGRHTTREVQLLRLNDQTYVADTPGFTQIALDDIPPHELKDYFPDFAPFEPECRFSGCIHQAEPECGVKQAVERGEFAQQRYSAYLDLLTEIAQSWKKRYR